MKKFIKLLDDNSNSILTDKEEYRLQIYGDGKKGNIKIGRNVLVRFNLDEKNICFNFSKDDKPYEFAYEGHYLPLESKVDEVKNLNHKDAETLYKVIKRFIADNN